MRCGQAVVKEAPGIYTPETKLGGSLSLRVAARARGKGW